MNTTKHVVLLTSNIFGRGFDSRRLHHYKLFSGDDTASAECTNSGQNLDSIRMFAFLLVFNSPRNIPALLRRCGANLLHCRSPFYLCLEHVDNLGAYSIPSETGLLISSAYDNYAGGTLTLTAAFRRNHASSAATGKPMRLSLGSLPLRTPTTPNTAAPTYSKPSRRKIQRRCRKSVSACSADFQVRHIVQARTADVSETPTITVTSITTGFSA